LPSLHEYSMHLKLIAEFDNNACFSNFSLEQRVKVTKTVISTHS